MEDRKIKMILLLCSLGFANPKSPPKCGDTIAEVTLKINEKFTTKTGLQLHFNGSGHSTLINGEHEGELTIEFQYKNQTEKQFGLSSIYIPVMITEWNYKYNYKNGK